MLKIKMSFVILLVLILSFALTSLLVGEEGTKPNPRYEEIGQTAVKQITTNWEQSRISPEKPSYTTPLTSGSPLLSEDFEGGVVPPAGWTADTNNTYTWGINSAVPYEGTYYASCNYDEFYTGTQDEWLISPSVDLTTGSESWHLYFYWNMSYYWGVEEDNYDYELWISTDGGANFTTKLWSEADAGSFTSWTWYKADIDLSSYLTYSDVKFGWRYYGYDGAQTNLDFILVDVPPIGRCCYGDPMSPSCADVTEDECNALSGSWTEGLNCTSNPCPIVGEGDNCTNPIVVNIPGDLPYSDESQYTCGRGNDYENTCLGYYDGGEDIIYELVVTSATNVDITLEPWYTSYTGICIDDECPPSDPCIAYSTNYSVSAHGMSVVQLEPGTYYIMIDTWPSPDCIDQFDLYITESAPPPDNDECEDAEVITSGQTVTGTTIGATVDCPGVLDWNAVWYKFELTEACNYVYVDYCPTTAYIYTVGVVLYDECPPSCSNYISALADSGAVAFVECPSGESRPRLWWFNLSPGTYWFPAYVVDGSYNPIDFSFYFYTSECPCYCYEAGRCDEYISNVQVGSINNASDCGLWSDFTSLSTDMVIGTGYPISITIGNAYSSDVGAVWVDWNQDCDFEDANEQITLSVSSGYGPYTGTITPPSGAVLGNTVMKIRLQYSGTPEICGVTSYGEVEDYGINVVSPNEPPNCNISPSPPFNVAEGDVINFTVSAVDPDAGDVVTIEGSGIPAGATMSPSLPVTGPTPQTSTFNWATGPGDAGNYTVTFIISDDDLEADTCTANITVVANDPPECNIVPPGPFTVYDGNNVSFVVTGTDPDAGDVVTITATGVPSGASLLPSPPVSGPSPKSTTFSWTPSPAQIGNYNVNFTITDSHGYEALCSVHITVNARPLSTTSNLGILILILLIVGTGVLIMLRRKKATAS